MAVLDVDAQGALPYVGRAAACRCQNVVLDNMSSVAECALARQRKRRRARAPDDILARSREPSTNVIAVQLIAMVSLA